MTILENPDFKMDFMLEGTALLQCKPQRGIIGLNLACSSVDQWDQMPNKKYFFTVTEILFLSFGTINPVGCYTNENARLAIVECQHTKKLLQGS